MPFKKFNTISSSIVATPIENIDTDQIIPARFLKSTTREGFGEAMFCDWRFNQSGTPKEDSIFSDSNREAQILVAGKNFGCGSSREHAAWAIADYGFRAVISSFFADIFKNNALNNGLLPVTVSPKFLDKILTIQRAEPTLTLEIDLPNETITIFIEGKGIAQEKFPIGEYKKACLINGQDDIDYLLTTRPLIDSKF